MVKDFKQKRSILAQEKILVKQLEVFGRNTSSQCCITVVSKLSQGKNNFLQAQDLNGRKITCSPLCGSHLENHLADHQW